MAIIGPGDLPHVLKADSNPLKLRMLHHFGHPNVRVELTEEQMEEMLRVTGDFICQYFPLEERYAYFYTQPLVVEYDLPEDAYWIREVAWDPVMNRIQDIFGAEMFLFCFGAGFKVVRKDGILVPIDEWEDKWQARTPYGNRKLKLTVHEEDQYLVKVNYASGSIACTPNQPIKTGGFDEDKSLEGWMNASDLKPGDRLVTQYAEPEVISVDVIEQGSTTTARTKVGCFYGCQDGEPILVH